MKKITYSTEEAENCVDTLNNIKNIVQEKIDDGEGLSNQSFKLIKDSINMVLSITDNNRKVIPIPTMGNGNSRYLNTKLAHESLNTTINIIKKKSVSLEVIRFQQRDKFVDDFTFIIEEYRNKITEKPNKELIKRYCEKIEILTLKRFGINILLLIDNKNLFSTYTLFGNGDITSNIEKIDISNANDKNTILNLSKDFIKNSNNKKGYIDLEKARVGGYFSLYTNVMFFNFDAAIRAEFSNREICSIFLHEIGHIFTNFEFSIYVDSFNSLISDITNKQRSFQEKKEIIFKHLNENDINMTEDNINKMLSENTIVSSYNWFKFISDTFKVQGERIHKNYKLNEQLADTFAVRFGLGSELSSSFNKIDNYIYTKDYVKKLETSNSLHILATMSLLTINLVTVIFFPITIILNILFFISLGLYKSLGGVKHDDTPHLSNKERYIFIKEQCISLLKEDSLNFEQVNIILDQIKLIDNLLSQTPDRELLFNKIIKFLSTNINYDQDRNRNRLNESLLNNNLFKRHKEITINI